MLVGYFINQHSAQSIHIDSPPFTLRTEEEFERITEAVIHRSGVLSSRSTTARIGSDGAV